MRKIVFCDFDGTIIYEDALTLLLSKYAKGDWEIYDKLVIEGKMTLEEGIKNQVSLIEYRDQSELNEYLIKNCNLRKGFKEFLNYCKNNNIEFVILSAGLDFYIYLILEKYGIKDIKIISPKTIFNNNKIIVEFPEVDKKYKNFKEEIVDKHSNYYTIFIGDGYSDLWPALKSRKILAIKNSLLDKVLKELKIEAFAIEDFFDVIKILSFSL
jgi:2-hydroxy-3-keto-5-methylthiopentenyl-1-phosphate phosphatase